MDYFFHRPDFYPSCSLPYKQKILYALKVTNFHGNRVKNESARKKITGGAPPPQPV